MRTEKEIAAKGRLIFLWTPLVTFILVASITGSFGGACVMALINTFVGMVVSTD